MTLAKIAFRGLKNGKLILFVDQLASSIIADLDHANVIVRAAFGTSLATDAGIWIDRDHSVIRIAGNCSCWATNHANRITAMHTSVRKEPLAVLRPLAHKAWISIMKGGASADAIIAASTTQRIDDHRFASIDQTFVDKELDQAGFNLATLTF